MNEYKRPKLPKELMKLLEERCDRFNSVMKDKPLSKIREILTEYFGEENFDMPEKLTPEAVIDTQFWNWRESQFEAYTKKNYLPTFTNMIAQHLPITFKYDAITMRNSLGEQATTRDVYVRIHVDEQGKLRSQFTVAVIGLTQKQVNTGIAHVHGGASHGFGVTCMGSADQPVFRSHTAWLAGFSENKVKAHLINIKAHLEWENREGGYAALSLIKGKSASDYKLGNINAPNYVRDAVFNALISKTDSASLLDTLNVEIKSGAVEVTPVGDKFEKLLAAIILSPETWPKGILRSYYNEGHAYRLVTVKDSHGSYMKAAVKTTNKKINVVNMDQPSLIFKGKPRYIRIIKEDQIIKSHNDKESDENTYYAHPDFTKRVCEELGKKLSIRWPETPGKEAGAQGAADNKPETAKSDIPSVQAGS